MRGRLNGEEERSNLAFQTASEPYTAPCGPCGCNVQSHTPLPNPAFAACRTGLSFCRERRSTLKLRQGLGQDMGWVDPADGKALNRGEFGVELGFSFRGVGTSGYDLVSDEKKRFRLNSKAY